MLLAGIITLCWLSFKTFPTLLFYSLFFGFTGGGFMSLVQAVCAELFGIEHIATVMGIVWTSMAFGGLLSTPVAGWLYEIQSDYTTPIVISGSFMIIGSIFIDFMSDKPNMIRIRSHTITQHHDIAQQSFLMRKHSNYSNNINSNSNININNNSTINMNKLVHKNISLFYSLLRTLHLDCLSNSNVKSKSMDEIQLTNQLKNDSTKVLINTNPNSNINSNDNSNKNIENNNSLTSNNSIEVNKLNSNESDNNSNSNCNNNSTVTILIENNSSSTLEAQESIV